MSYKQPVSVLIIIYTRPSSSASDEGFEVLLLERADFPGYWQSVTGSREGEETLRETALREIFEETGLDSRQYILTDWQLHHIYDIYPKWQHRYPPGITHNTEHVFSLCLPSAMPVTLSPREHINQVWLPWKDAAEKVFSPSNRDSILQLPERMS